MPDKPLTTPLDNYDREIPVFNLDGLITALQCLRDTHGNLPVAIATQYSEDSQICDAVVYSGYIRLVPANFEE